MAAIISLYKRANDTKSESKINIDDFLLYIKDGKWQDYVLPIRAIPDIELRKEEKKKVPCVTLSGEFTERKDDSIIRHSGYIGIDIDDCEPEEMKSILAPDHFIYSIFTSISGTGVCAIFRIDGAKHREAFAGISEYLYNTYNICIDPTSVNPSRARFVSYDPHIYLAERVEKFTLYPKVKPPKKIDRIIYIQSDFDLLINEILQNRVNLCENYHDWLRIGFAIADKFGESGRSYFHQVSQFSTKYHPDSCNKQYTNCIKGNNTNKVTISTFYYYCKNANLKIYSDKTKKIIEAASVAKKSEKTEQDAIKLLQEQNITEQESKSIVQQVYADSSEYTGNDNLISQVEQWLKHNYTFRRNIITRYIEHDNKPLQAKDFNTIFITSKKVFPKITFEIIEKLINSNFTPDYNPIHEFMDKHKDRKPEGVIETLFSTLRTDDDAFTKYFGKKWLVGIISAIYGEHSPLMLVLSGEIQGTGKTEWLRRLLPKELMPYYAESKLDAGKDDEILMTQKLLIMDDEMGGKSKAESKRLKELTSKQVFSLREPYGRNNVDLHRLAVLCGTTNDKQILNDPTGNRRLIPFHVVDVDKEKYNKIDKIDVIMEAYHMYKNNYNWQLTTEDIKILALHGDDFQSYTGEYELILKYFNLPSEGDEEFLTASEVRIILERNSMQKLSLDRIGKELQRIGFKQVIKKIDGKTKRVYGVEQVTSVTAKLHQGVTSEKPFG